MRMAGQVWFPPANQMGQGCAKKPEQYPALVKPTMSHGDPTKTIGMPIGTKLHSLSKLLTLSDTFIFQGTSG